MKNKPRLLIYSGWILFLVSLPLPAMTFMGEAASGWRVTLISIMSLSELSGDTRLEDAYLLVVGFYNFFLLLSPAIYWKMSRGRRFLSRKLIVFSFMLPVSCFFYFDGLHGGLQAGYYFWFAGSLLVTVGLSLRKRSRGPAQDPAPA